VLISYSSAIFTCLGLDLIKFAASHVGGSQLTSHILLSVHLSKFPLHLRVLAGWTVSFFWLVCSWAGILAVIATKLHEAIPMVGANACAALKHTLLVVGFCFIIRFFPCYGVSSRFRSKDFDEPPCACSYRTALRGWDFCSYPAESPCYLHPSLPSKDPCVQLESCLHN